MTKKGTLSLGIADGNNQCFPEKHFPKQKSGFLTLGWHIITYLFGITNLYLVLFNTN
jgi:hypothetical protein